MDPELKRLLCAMIAGQVVWMVKDMFLGARSQTQKNTEDIGAIKEKQATMKADLNAAHSAIRELKGRKSS